MASAGRAGTAVPGRSRRDRSLAVQERPRLLRLNRGARCGGGRVSVRRGPVSHRAAAQVVRALPLLDVDRKSTRLNSSHSQISYAVFCLKKKKKKKKKVKDTK